MDKKSTHELLLDEALENLKRKIPSKSFAIVLQFIDCYQAAIGPLFDDAIPNLLLFLQLTEAQFHNPHDFDPYHKKVRHPIDYYRFGIDFILPLVDTSASFILGEEILEQIQTQVKLGENVVLLANHQTETDPQAISILLEKKYPEIASQIIYVAGERVLTDPLAIPFSLGCDLLCIYSRRYIDHPIELKAKKQLHNKGTMEKMGRLLQDGGKIIYVAPSGGRDRRNGEGIVEVAPFDADSIEFFHLMARKAKTVTHFIPLALSTYDLMPPPETVQKELGEIRLAKRTPIAIGFAAPLGSEQHTVKKANEVNKIEYRQSRAKEIWSIVNRMHGTMVAKIKETR